MTYEDMMKQPKTGDVIVVWFSSGAASAVAASETIRQFPDCEVRVVNNPIADEDPDNLRFLQDVEAWLHRPIEIAKNPKWPNCSVEEVWEHKKFMSGPKGAPCTTKLKKEARQHWESNNQHDWLVLGFTVEEQGRFDRFRQGERENILPVLIAGNITKDQCYTLLLEQGLKLPRTYYEGWPNANCPGCVKATSPTYWNFVREKRPDVFEARAEMSKRLGAKLVRVKGERVFLSDLDPSARGQAMKSMTIDCGIFCEEP